MKRQETLLIENKLIEKTREERIYGCEEITIGFYNAGHGNEIVDFMTMDSKGIIKCYEIKVTLQDLKSNAKKSWYGHYNYLVVTDELYNKVTDWTEYIPSSVGIIRATIKGNWISFTSTRKSKKIKIDNKTETMLKESMVRSIYWKMVKYKNAESIEERNKLEKKIRETNKSLEQCYKRAVEAESIINEYETYFYHNHGKDIDLKSEAKKEKEEYFKRRRKDWEKN